MKRIHYITLILLLVCTGAGAQEYKGLTALETLTLPAGTTEIGNKAFAGCRSLTQVTCTNGTVPTCAVDAFAVPTIGKAGQATLTAGSAEYAAAAGWQFFAVINTVENSENRSATALATTGSDWVVGVTAGEPLHIDQATLAQGVCYTAFFQEATGALVCDADATLTASPEGSEQALTAGTVLSGVQPGSYLLRCGDRSARVEIRTSTQEQ